MGYHKQETFWGLNGETAVVTVGSSNTTITITDKNGEWLVFNQHILGYSTVTGRLCYTEINYTTPVTYNEVVDFEVRPTVTWSR